MLDAPSVGPRRVLKLLKTYGTAVTALEALGESSSGDSPIGNFIATSSNETYEAMIQRTIDIGGNFKLWSDEDYPANLRRWVSHPPILFFKGDLSLLQRRSLALVGRTDPTSEGIRAAERFAMSCVANDIQVISGLAKGIDAASHRSALMATDGITFAVLGHGLDHSFPRENEKLFAEIPCHGALISQFRTGVGPQKWTFPARNEVMCTLALGTVIIEAKPRCGSLIQADFSFKHGRPVFILSRNLRTANAAWAEELVLRGAHVVEHFDQVLEIVSAQEDFVSVKLQPSGVVSLFDATPSEDGQQDFPSAALFDLDGVVVDTRDATAVALASIASRHTGIVFDPKETRVEGKPHELLGRMGVKDPYNVYKREYDPEFFNALGEVRVFSEVVEGIERIKARGVRIAAITSQSHSRINYLLPRSVQAVFEKVYTYRETGGKKEVGIAKALDFFGVAREHAVFVGDQSTDLEAARKSGVKAVGVLWGFSTLEQLRQWPSDLLVDEQSELEPAVTELLSE